MWGSVVFYGGVILAAVGLLLVLRPGAFRVRTRSQALLVVVTGLLLGGLGLSLPAPEHRVAIAKSHLDRLVPVWQFHEIHSLKVAATPERVYRAIQRVRADEISLFRTLTWIRRGGRPSGPNILNPGSSAPLIEVATNSGFVRLVDSAPRELVIGTLVVKPPGDRRAATPEVFRERLPAGFALAAMNFLVVPDGKGHSILETETRVSASDPTARRRFAAYWRIIYPGSAIIRRMWLRAVRHRATATSP